MPLSQHALSATQRVRSKLGHPFPDAITPYRDRKTNQPPLHCSLGRFSNATLDPFLSSPSILLPPSLEHKTERDTNITLKKANDAVAFHPTRGRR